MCHFNQIFRHYVLLIYRLYVTRIFGYLTLGKEMTQKRPATYWNGQIIRAEQTIKGFLKEVIDSSPCYHAMVTDRWTSHDVSCTLLLDMISCNQGEILSVVLEIEITM